MASFASVVSAAAAKMIGSGYNSSHDCSSAFTTCPRWPAEQKGPALLLLSADIVFIHSRLSLPFTTTSNTGSSAALKPHILQVISGACSSFT